VCGTCAVGARTGWTVCINLAVHTSTGRAMSDTTVGTATQVTVSSSAARASTSGCMVDIHGEGRRGGSQCSWCARNECRRSAISLRESRSFPGVADNTSKAEGSSSTKHCVKAQLMIIVTTTRYWMILSESMWIFLEYYCWISKNRCSPAFFWLM
jgi:hypothetical protein